MIKTIDQSPTISDQVRFVINTPDTDGCFKVDPYKVRDVTIYFLQRNINSSGEDSIDYQIVNNDLANQLAAAKKIACDFPTDDNIQKVATIQLEINANSIKNTVYFSDNVTIFKLGTPEYPAWLSTDQTEAQITIIPNDPEGNPQYGHFEYVWNPIGMREGDYIITWSWEMAPSGTVINSFYEFTLWGDSKATTSIPTHIADPLKYETLLERYTPKFLKLGISKSDISPEVIQEFNNSVAKGFTFIENFSDQLIDLIDANVVSESFLPLLGNTFNLKLRSNDPTLWRRQIKRAVPLFKKKGTHRGLEEALAQAGITLNRFTRLWQVSSDYTWQEAFTSDGDSLSFTLEKNAILPVDQYNFELYYRPFNSTDWTILNQDYVDLESIDGKTIMTWIGDYLSTNPIHLDINDTIRVVYQYVEIQNSTEQAIEDYIRTLPLYDLRDDRLQVCPKKNWNTRVLDEDDALFSVIVPVREPYFDPVIFGKVRTEFAYSENVYNMDEYNGSKRDSNLPCDIDCDFIDACHSCLGSEYNIQVSIDQISNDRILEVESILKEFLPFHAVLHSIHISGKFEDYLQIIATDVNILASGQYEENTLIDPPETIFNRSMEYSSQLKRNAMASDSVVSSGTAVASNDKIVFFYPDGKLDAVGIDESDSSLTYLEVLSSVNSGVYNINNPKGNIADVIGSVVEPLDNSVFSFRLSNQRLRKQSTTITQDNVFIFKDSASNTNNFINPADFDRLGIKTQWDVDNDPNYTGDAATLTTTYGDCLILQLLPDNQLLIENNGVLPSGSVSNLVFTIKNGDNTIITTGNRGKIVVNKRGLVDYSGGVILYRNNSMPYDSSVNLSQIISSGDFLLYEGDQYQITGFNGNHTFYIKDYDSGDVSGVETIIYRRLIDKKVGNFDYRGMTLVTSTNEEAGLGILNGVNAPIDPNDITDNDLFKENFLVLIGSNYYKISQIDGYTISIDGPMNDWTLLGTNINYSIIKFIKIPISIPERILPATPGHDFSSIDRRGDEVFEIVTEVSPPMAYLATELNSSGPVDAMGIQEDIIYTIEYKE